MKRTALLPGLALGLLLVAPPAAATDHELPLGEGVLVVSLDADVERGAGEAEVLAWIAAEGAAVATWFGGFPLARANVYVRDGSGRSAFAGGRAFEGSPPYIQGTLGRSATGADLRRDWVLPHEISHLHFPNLAERHGWMEEGMATYVEPWARLQGGRLGREKAWADLVEGLPKGLPRAGDRGLDRTPTWGRTYWGGALFWFLADLEILRRTEGKAGLQEAMRGIVAAGGDIRSDWTVARVIEAGDAATGVPVLAELYEAMRASPHPVDLDALWARLGVRYEAGVVSFDESAPEAWLVAAIERVR